MLSVVAAKFIDDCQKQYSRNKVKPNNLDRLFTEAYLMESNKAKKKIHLRFRCPRRSIPLPSAGRTARRAARPRTKTRSAPAPRPAFGNAPAGARSRGWRCPYRHALASPWSPAGTLPGWSGSSSPAPGRSRWLRACA